MSPSAVKPGSLKDPSIASLFSKEDPEDIYEDLREIGHGSFGAVFYAQNVNNQETVAIKKMNFSGKQAQEKWLDIIKEVQFLKQVKNDYIVEYKGCYLKDYTCWLVMEYCIGSCSDVIEVLKKPLLESEISSIASQALLGLTFLHSLPRIHRDIKAGNILLTDQGIVKLGDLGSVSTTCPAQSFVGTPYWMAPEVIMAMEDGLYDDRADIWSFGITCLELAEQKPPLFNRPAMSALYHIAQNEPPKLGRTKQNGEDAGWSEEFHNFIDKCLQTEPKKRMTSSESSKHPFILNRGGSKLSSTEVILKLIKKTKLIVQEQDNSQYRKMRKLMYLDEQHHHKSNSNEYNGVHQFKCINVTGDACSLDSHGTDDDNHSNYQRNSNEDHDSLCNSISSLQSNDLNNGSGSLRKSSGHSNECPVKKDAVSLNAKITGSNFGKNQNYYSVNRNENTVGIPLIGVSSETCTPTIIFSSKIQPGDESPEVGTFAVPSTYPRVHGSMKDKVVTIPEDTPLTTGQILTSKKSSASMSASNDDSTSSNVLASSQDDVSSKEFLNLDEQSYGIDNEKISLHGPLSLHRSPQEKINTLRRSKFSTLRTTKIISKEVDEYKRENNMYEQMVGYKRLRQQHQKEIKIQEDKNNVELDGLRLKLEREYDQLIQASVKELNKIRQQGKSQMDRLIKEHEEAEKKMKKQKANLNDYKFKTFVNLQKKEYKHNKERLKVDLKGRALTRSEYEIALKNSKLILQKDKEEKEQTFYKEQQINLNTEYFKLRKEHLVTQNNYEHKWLEDEYNKKSLQLETSHSLLRKHHELTKDKEIKCLGMLEEIKKRHLRIQHDTELNHQNDHNNRIIDEMRKKHALQSKQQPKELKNKEILIRKQFRHAVKIRAKQFKTYQNQLLATVAKEEQKELINKLKDEQKRKISALADEYERSIGNMVSEQTVQLETWQEEEEKSLSEKLKRDINELKQFQEKQRNNLEITLDKERKALFEKIEKRRLELEEKISQEIFNFNEEKCQRFYSLEQKQQLKMDGLIAQEMSFTDSSMYDLQSESIKASNSQFSTIHHSTSNITSPSSQSSTNNITSTPTTSTSGYGSPITITGRRSNVTDQTNF
uniref:non-specific serine/threonine protein kinase n=1 Tax=Strongyloides venezuelensis TaxID=75913 RepID=A0A0K0FUX3_STRVS